MIALLILYTDQRTCMYDKIILIDIKCVIALILLDSMFFCLFVCVGFIVPLANFSLIWRRLNVLQFVPYVIEKISHSLNGYR